MGHNDKASRDSCYRAWQTHGNRLLEADQSSWPRI